MSNLFLAFEISVSQLVAFITFVVLGASGLFYFLSQKRRDQYQFEKERADSLEKAYKEAKAKSDEHEAHCVKCKGELEHAQTELTMLYSVNIKELLNVNSITLKHKLLESENKALTDEIVELRMRLLKEKE